MDILIQPIPAEFEKDISMAINILKDAGCSEIYVFGSIANQDYNSNSDIDLAVRGLPEELFFKTSGKLMKYLDHQFDLIDLDEAGNRFNSFITQKGKFIRVA